MVYGQFNRGGSAGYSRQGQPNQPQREFPNSGALFPAKQKNSPNSPDMNGNFTLDGDVLAYVLDLAQRGQKVELEVKGWHRTSRSNANYISLSMDIPWQIRKPQQPNAFRHNTSNQQDFREAPPAGSFRGGPQQQGTYGQQTGPQAGGQTATGSNPYAAARGGQGRFNLQQSRPNYGQELNDEIPF